MLVCSLACVHQGCAFHICLATPAAAFVGAGHGTMLDVKLCNHTFSQNTAWI